MLEPGTSTLWNASAVFAIFAFTYTMIGTWLGGWLLKEGENLRKALLTSAIWTVLVWVTIVTFAWLMTSSGISAGPFAIAIVEGLVILFAYIPVVKYTYRTSWSHAAVIWVIYLITATVLGAIAGHTAVAGIISSTMGVNNHNTSVSQSSNPVAERAVKTSQNTMESALPVSEVAHVYGLSDGSGNVRRILVEVRLAPGSSPIDMNQATVTLEADGGQIYRPYKKFAGFVDSETSKIPDGAFAVVKSDSQGNMDKYLEAGEMYTIAIDTPALSNGVDWVIQVSTPYTSTLRVAGALPDNIEPNSKVKLR